MPPLTALPGTALLTACLWAAAGAALVYAVAAQHPMLAGLPARRRRRAARVVSPRWRQSGAVAGSAAGLTLAYLLAAAWTGEGHTPLGAAAALGLGALAPPGASLLRQHRRRQALDRGYYLLLSHLLLQIEAGAGLRKAFSTAGPAVGAPLAQHLGDLAADLQVAPLPAALQRFARATQHGGIAELTATLAGAQTLGLDLTAALRQTEDHARALLRQRLRRRVQAAAVTMAAVTVVLLINGVLLYGTPAIMAFLRFLHAD